MIPENVKSKAIEIVGRYYAIPVEKMGLRIREKPFVIARQMTLKILRDYSIKKGDRYSYHQLAVVFDFNHANVMHSVKTLADVMVYDLRLKTDYTVLIGKLEKELDQDLSIAHYKSGKLSENFEGWRGEINKALADIKGQTTEDFQMEGWRKVKVAESLELIEERIKRVEGALEFAKNY